METAQSPIHQKLDGLANSNIGEFKQFFRRLHKLFPQQAAEACLLYLASHGLDDAGKSMGAWLVADVTYISVLLDPEILSIEVAAKALPVLKEVDTQFLFRFAKGTSTLESPAAILHSLALVSALGDYSIFIPWLRTLNQSLDHRVRSRAAKLLCELRPNKGLIERQMQSPDARVRAGAVEALWQQTQNAETRSMLQSALSDPHHRVVTNALVGLYRMGDPGALQQIMDLATHKEYLFRAACAWSLGFVGDTSSIPTLQDLSRDSSMVVRKRALKSLLHLESIKTAEREPADAPAATPEPERVEDIHKLAGAPQTLAPKFSILR